MAKVFADDISLCPADEPLVAYRRFAIIDSSGNNNRKLDRGETGDCILTLRCNAGSVTNLTGTLRSLDPALEVLQASAGFGSLSTGDSARNATSRFVLRAGPLAPIEVPLWCELALSGGSGFRETLRVPILVGDSVNEPLGPDAYGYYAFDNQDITYAQHPTYDWVEIRNLGTRLTLGDDATQTIDLPPEFGPIYYYGQRTTKLSVCSNGWVAPDTSTRLDFNNITLPDPLAPQRIIALLWDNLDPTPFGWVGYYHDAANHRFIIEYDSVPYFPQYVAWEKFEVIFYDTTLASPSGDNVFKVQYATANNIGSTSSGIQDNSGRVGLNYLWNTFYPRPAAPIVPGRAILYWAEPRTGIAGPPVAFCGPRTALRAQPNPLDRRTELAYDLTRAGTVRIDVYDASGRLVQTLGNGPQAAGSHRTYWDAGSVPEGVYFCRLVTARDRQELKLVVAK
jgi:hypothetical protein